MSAGQYRNFGGQGEMQPLGWKLPNEISPRLRTTA